MLTNKAPAINSDEFSTILMDMMTSMFKKLNAVDINDDKQVTESIMTSTRNLMSKYSDKYDFNDRHGKMVYDAKIEQNLTNKVLKLGRNIFEIITDEKNHAIGMNQIRIGAELINYNYNKKQKNWIEEDVVITIDDANLINFAEYYPSERSAIKFNDHQLLVNSLKDDIEYLLKYSYCFNDGDSYYFPTINIVVWTNKEEDKPGYSLGIYKYGYYDAYMDPNFIDAINNNCNYKIGEKICTKKE